MAEPSPQIRDVAWGRIATDAGAFRDIKLWPGGGRGWDWRETGTRHVPGVQPVDVVELLDPGAEVVVIGQGQQGRLLVMDDTLALLRDRGVTAQVLGTREAVARYNALARAGTPIGALIHTTC